MIGNATREQVKNAYPMLREDEVNQYFTNDHDGDYEYEAERQATGVELHDSEYEESYAASNEDDGQPSEYEEWQDYMGGDDWDHGQCDSEY